MGERRDREVRGGCAAGKRERESERMRFSLGKSD